MQIPTVLPVCQQPGARCLSFMASAWKQQLLRLSPPIWYLSSITHGGREGGQMFYQLNLFIPHLSIWSGSHWKMSEWIIWETERWMTEDRNSRSCHIFSSYSQSGSINTVKRRCHTSVTLTESVRSVWAWPGHCRDQPPNSRQHMHLYSKRNKHTSCDAFTLHWFPSLWWIWEKLLLVCKPLSWHV